jgi:hypothetical protein
LCSGRRARPATDADDADGEQSDQALDQEFLRGAVDDVELPGDRVDQFAGAQRDLGAGRELVGRVQGVADEQPGEQNEDRARADQQNAVQQGQAQAQGGTEADPVAAAAQVDGHEGATTTGAGTR